MSKVLLCKARDRAEETSDERGEGVKETGRQVCEGCSVGDEKQVSRRRKGMVGLRKGREQISLREKGGGRAHCLWTAEK